MPKLKLTADERSLINEHGHRKVKIMANLRGNPQNDALCNTTLTLVSRAKGKLDHTPETWQALLDEIDADEKSSLFEWAVAAGFEI